MQLTWHLVLILLLSSKLEYFQDSVNTLKYVLTMFWLTHTQYVSYIYIITRQCYLEVTFSSNINSGYLSSKSQSANKIKPKGSRTAEVCYKKCNCTFTPPLYFLPGAVLSSPWYLTFLTNQTFTWFVQWVRANLVLTGI